MWFGIPTVLPDEIVAGNGHPVGDHPGRKIRIVPAFGRRGDATGSRSLRRVTRPPTPWVLHHPRSDRSLCTHVTASDPSPTAKPTRLVDPDRISPAARTPGSV